MDARIVALLTNFHTVSRWSGRRLGEQLHLCSHLLRKHKQPLGDPALDCCTVDARINISHQSSRGLAAKPCSEECGFCY